MFDSEEYTALRDSSETFRSRVAELNDIAASRGTLKFGLSWKMEVFSATPVETDKDDGYMVSGLVSSTVPHEVAGERKLGEEVFVGFFIPLVFFDGLSLSNAFWTAFSSNAVELGSTRYEFTLMSRASRSLTNSHSDVLRGRMEVFGFFLDSLRDVLCEKNRDEHDKDVLDFHRDADAEEVVSRTLDRVKREDETSENIGVVGAWNPDSDDTADGAPRAAIEQKDE